MSSFSTGYNGVNLARRANIRRVNRVSNAGRAVICPRIRSRSCHAWDRKRKKYAMSIVADLVSRKIVSFDSMIPCVSNRSMVLKYFERREGGRGGKNIYNGTKKMYSCM